MTYIFCAMCWMDNFAKFSISYRSPKEVSEIQVGRLINPQKYFKNSTSILSFRFLLGGMLVMSLFNTRLIHKIILNSSGVVHSPLPFVMKSLTHHKIKKESTVCFPATARLILIKLQGEQGKVKIKVSNIQPILASQSKIVIVSLSQADALVRGV